MSEIDQTLMFSLLPEIRDSQKTTVSKIAVISEDIRSIKGHMASFMANEVVQDTRIAELVTRLERVERRLELREEN